VTHRTAPSFWQHYNALPLDVRRVADANFQLLKKNSRHPSLHFKKVNKYWSVRAGIHYRALAVESGDEMVWFWIGPHTDYEKRLFGS